MNKWLGIFVVEWLLVAVPVTAFAQGPEQVVPLTFDGLLWKSFVQAVRSDLNIGIFYHPDSIPELIIHVAKPDLSLEEVLRNNLEPAGLYFLTDGSGNIIVTKSKWLSGLPDNFFARKETVEMQFADSALRDEEIHGEFLQTRKEYIPIHVIIGSKKEGVRFSYATVSGTLKNAADGSPIVNGNLYVEEIRKGTTTDESGYYSLRLKKGTYTLVMSSLESMEVKYKMEVYSDGMLNVQLEPRLYLLEEFVVSSQKNHNLRGSQMGFEKLSTKNIQEVPVVLGEKDIIKVALLLPGVQSVGEGSTGFNVRGSPADQNLFYLEHVPVYNSSHLFGFFSAFNSDAVSDFSLMKSNIPAEYGGRLASIFDITSRTGNMDHFSARGGISPVTARILAEGPIRKGKSSYMVGLRSTYSDWILRLTENPDLRSSKAYFGDAMANFTFKPDARNEIKWVTYFSYDDANIAGLTRDIYSNAGGSLNWIHEMNRRATFGLTLASGRYAFEDRNMEYEQFAYKQSFELNHHELKADFTWRLPNNHAISFGLNSILYQVNTGDFLPYDGNSTVSPKQFEPEKGLENGIYISDQFDLTKDLQITAGLRYNAYSYLGPKTVYTYDAEAPKTPETIEDTLRFGQNELIKNYGNPDYRIGFRYSINRNLSVKGSYNRLHQYIFMLSNTIAISPTDTWKLCEYNIEPMTGDQASLGLYANVFSEILEVSLEGYWKEVHNLVEYKDGAEMVANEIPETDIIQGDLNAHGIELMVRKPLGRLTGWVNYTYSRAQVLVEDDITGEQNNFGDPYPANYDKPHTLNLVTNYRLTRRLNVSGNLVYSTGRPITYPTAIYYQNGMKMIHYSVRNEYRLPDYFRVDVSVNLEGNLKAKKFAHGSWNLSVYNLLGRKNAYSVYFKTVNDQIRGYKLSIFGVPIFSITYNFKLGNYEN